eukprot:354792-Chlamydomonas_euryale.AAC.12
MFRLTQVHRAGKKAVARWRGESEATRGQSSGWRGEGEAWDQTRKLWVARGRGGVGSDAKALGGEGKVRHGIRRESSGALALGQVNSRARPCWGLWWRSVPIDG